MRKFLIIVPLFLTHCTTRQIDRPPYWIDHPLPEPVEFADGQITTSNGISFSKDGMELYTSSTLDSKFEDGRARTGIYRRIFQDGAWGSAAQMDLHFIFDAYHPVLSPDNNFLYFNSRSDVNDPDSRIPHNIWRARRTKSGWSTPKMVPQINSDQYDSYPTVARNGNLYFNSDRPGGKGGMDIYVSYFQNGQFQEPINLDVLNSADVENDLVIAANESFIIFNRYIAATKEVDLFIAKQIDGKWQPPNAIDQINMSGKWELTPSLSPDGQYFFYELDQKIMQVDIEMLLHD